MLTKTRYIVVYTIKDSSFLYLCFSQRNEWFTTTSNASGAEMFESEKEAREEEKRQSSAITSKYNIESIDIVEVTMTYKKL